jgi:dipeptidyl aminopeptidase/acylaminoacyl peptidase
MEKLEGIPLSRICLVESTGGPLQEITSGPNSDMLPRWSPDGRQLAFLSDRAEKGQFQLYLLEAGRLGEALATPAVDGTVEYLAWSPDGRKIVLGVAGRGADLSGGQGSGTTKDKEQDLPSWMPTVDRGMSDNQWRRLHVYDVAAKTTTVLSRERLNVWEAVWAGSDGLLAVVSEGPTEDDWYSAPLALIDATTGNERILYRSEWQLGLPAASPGGELLAIVEAVCSDRLVVAGNVLAIDRDTGGVTAIETDGVDVSYIHWQNATHLLFAGIRQARTVFGECDLYDGTSRELWETIESSGHHSPEISPLGADAFVMALGSYERYPELVVVRHGSMHTVLSLAHAGTEYVRSAAGRMQEVSWEARDGREIGGWLVTPDRPGPYPLIVHVHGGPVSAWQNSWVTRMGADTPLLVQRGYAVLFPNPRGSWGKGQEFARQVYGDMGGEDTYDILTGIDALVNKDIADPTRIGVTGGSYGGYMTSWLITQDNRFAAAVSVAPVTDWPSFHWTTNIGVFDRLFLQDEPTNPTQRYHDRSPVMFAANARTPTLNIAGLVDRCTPASQAVEFHRALLENGVRSELVLYPEEGHGVRQFPAAIDYVTRLVDWFQEHMPADRPVSDKVETETRETVAAGKQS